MTRTETWQGIRPFEISGRWFELFSQVNPVNVRAYDNQGQMIANESQVSVGFRIDRRGTDDKGRQLRPFARIEIDTTGNEAVGFFYSDGTTGYVSRTDIADRTGRQLGHLSPAAHTNSAKTATNASAVMLAANASRSYLQVQVPSNQPAGIRIRTDGGVAVDDNTSIEILPGQSYAPLVPPSGAINVIRKGGVDILFNVTEG